MVTAQTVAARNAGAIFYTDIIILLFGFSLLGWQCLIAQRTTAAA